MSATVVLRSLLTKLEEPATSAGSHTKTGSLIDVITVVKGVATVVGSLVVQHTVDVWHAIERRDK